MICQVKLKDNLPMFLKESLILQITRAGILGLAGIQLVYVIVLCFGFLLLSSAYSKPRTFQAPIPCQCAGTEEAKREHGKDS